VVGFDPDHSDWPRQAGFVIFFRNLLESARARRAAGGIAPGRIGDALRIPAPDGTEVTVTAPDGSEQRGVSRGGIAIVPVPAIPGRFAVRWCDQRFALRNLLDAEESDLNPAPARGHERRHHREVSEARGPSGLAYVAGFLLFVLAIGLSGRPARGACVSCAS
jgi:hypothetical protein